MDTIWSRGIGMAVQKMRLTSITCACLGILMLIPSCAILNPAAEAEAAPGDTMLRIGFIGTISTLNPFRAYTENDLFFASLVYDGLTSFDQDLSPVPNLANSCYIVPDALPYGSVWQYNLTHNATWHDGEPMTAEDVSFTVDYQTGVNYTIMWNSQPCTLWIDHTLALDDYTVRVYFRNVSGDPAPCAFGDRLVIPIVPKHIWQSISPADASLSFVNSFPIGTGPFMATASTYNEFVGGVNVTLLRNPSYHWASDYGKQVNFDKIDLRYYDNDTQLKDALLSNEIDVARFNYSTYAQLKSGIQGGSTANVITMTGLRPDGYFSDVGFNMHSGGGNLARLDPWVRIALAMATNKSEIVETIYGGDAEEGSTLVSPIYPYWHLALDPGDEFPYNPPAALVLLLMAGYDDSDSDGILEAGPDSMTVQMGWEPEGTHLSFDLMVRWEQPEDLKIALALQAAYLQIGVVTTVYLADTLTFIQVMYAYNYDMMICGWEQEPDPNRMLFAESTYSINGWSDNCYSNVEYDENYSVSVSELDPATRQESVQNCQAINYVETPYIVLAYLNQTYVRRTDTFTGWGNWTSHPGRSLDSKWSANPLFFDLLPNSAPTASFTVVPTTGDTLTSFEFDASGSSDSEDAVVDLEVRWDYENDGTWDTGWSTEKATDHLFSASATYTVKLEVRDTVGLTNTTTMQVDVVEVIPEFSMIIPIISMLLLIPVVARGRFRRC
jgi:peptide/nickel transport system substrate-binding protein